MSTRINQLKRRKIATDIEREAVPGDTALHAHANGADLAVTDPAAGCTITPLRCDTERRTRGYQRRLKCANVCAK